MGHCNQHDLFNKNTTYDDKRIDLSQESVLGVWQGEGPRESGGHPNVKKY
jgi:hypothetical protein